MLRSTSSIKDTLRRLVLDQYIKMLYIDLTADNYEVLRTDSDEPLPRMLPTAKISEWFSLFAESPYMYPGDRSAFRIFSDLDTLRQNLTSNGLIPMRLVYHRRRMQTDELYRPVVMEIVPHVAENGHLMAFLFVKEITTVFDDIARPGAANQSSLGSPGKLLIISGDIGFRNKLSEILLQKYGVMVTASFARGTELMREYYRDISLVLPDAVHSPERVYEFLKYTAKDPMLKHIPMLAVTEKAGSEITERCLELGAADFISEPYTPASVLSRVTGLVSLKESESTIRDLEYDNLTGMFSRQAFIRRAERILLADPAAPYCMIISDIADMRRINEMFGESAGDTLLVKASMVFRKSMPEGSLTARYGGDQFVCLAKCGEDFNSSDLLPVPFEVTSADGVKCTLKTGIYERFEHDLPVSTVCDRAFEALVSIKGQYGPDCAFYDVSLEERTQRQYLMKMAMHPSLAAGDFKVFYQPKHDAMTGKLIGAEALIRWVHPQLGFLSPAEFIPLFEKNGFITSVDHFVWKNTCRNLRRWLDKGLCAVPVSVNASRLDFKRENFFDAMRSQIDKAGLSPEYLHIEVTESLFSEQSDRIKDLLEQCRGIGVKIELDDFGAGYNSLNTLGLFPLDIVKLDRSFVKHLDDPKRVRLVEACIGLMKKLELKVICEGVETEEQLNCLKSLGCDAIQGYYYSRPLPEPEFEEYLKTHG